MLNQLALKLQLNRQKKSYYEQMHIIFISGFHSSTYKVNLVSEYFRKVFVFLPGVFLVGKP